jgi:hypothetical protein
MPIRYHHTQTGWVMIIGAIAALIPIVVLSVFSNARNGLLLAAVIVAVTAWLFFSLTIDVTDNDLTWRFGPGLWAHRVAREEIEVVRRIKTKWYWGYGIKYFGPNRWLYNVSGTDAVEIKLRNGGWRRIGTDDPNGLLGALTKADIASLNGDDTRGHGSAKTE